MKWIKVRDCLPPDQEPVLIRQDSEVQLGYYDEARGKFILSRGGTISISVPDLMWMDLVRPPDS